MRDGLIILSIVAVVCISVGTIIVSVCSETKQHITSEKRLQPEKEFAIEGKIESIMFQDGEVAVVSALPSSTPNSKVKRVYIFDKYFSCGGGKNDWDPLTYCKRVFDIREMTLEK